MAENVHSDIIINVDTSVGIAEIKNLQRQISSLNAQLMQSGANQAKAAQNIQRNLLNNINATGQFAARVKTISSTAETFTQRLEKNKFGMGEYFRYAGGASKTFGKLFKKEFDTIEKVARERVKTLQTQYTKLGRDANGALRAISVRPLALDMENLATKTAIAAQKQQLFNQLMKQGSTNLLNFGKNTQWAGRQLMVGFSIPLAYLGTAAAKTFMKMEEQAIRFKRVYGDTFTASSETDKMIEQVKTLANEFTKYGVAAEKTMQMAANAAAMGKQGSDLLAQVNQATRLAVLGGVEQEQALETTISLTNAFGIAAENLSGKINFLNAVENQTVTSIEDLTIAVPKAGPVIQQLGGDVEDLAFFLTAMKEGGINASEGANALKSGLASLINPTAKASEMLGAMGVNITGIVEANKGDVKGTVVGFAKALDTLDPLNRARAIEQLFGKFQFARLSTLFQNVIAEGSQANRVLKLSNATSAELAVLSEREMKRIEDSPMYKFKKVVEDIKISLVPLGEAFLKAITPIGEFVKGFLDKFNSMGDGAKQFAVIATTVVAGIGPVLLMTFGLIANGAANLIKLFLGIRRIFQGVGTSSQTLGSQTEYMTQQQLEAAAIASSLDQVHGRLIQTFSSETNAVNNLASAYARAVVAQRKLAGIPLVPTGAKGAKAGKAPMKLKSGIVSVPGPKGAGDVVPAMLSPGESVIPAKMTQKYGGLIDGMVNDNIPGFKSGLSPFRNIARRYSIGEDSVPKLSQAEIRRIEERLKSNLRSTPRPIKKEAEKLTYGSEKAEQDLIRRAFGNPKNDKGIQNYLRTDVSHLTPQTEMLNIDGKLYEAKKWALGNVQIDRGLVNQGLNYLSMKKIGDTPFFKTFDPKVLASKTGLSVGEVNKEIKALIRNQHPASVNAYKVLAEMAEKSGRGYGKPLAKLLRFRIEEYQNNVPGSYLKALEDGKIKFDPKKVNFASLEESGRRFYKNRVRTANAQLANFGNNVPAQKVTKTPKAPNPKKVNQSLIESYGLKSIIDDGNSPKPAAIKGGRLGAIARLFGRPMAFGGVVKPNTQSRLLSFLMKRSRVSTRMPSNVLTEMLGKGDTKYRSAFETGTGADYLTKHGTPNTNQARTRRMMEKDAMGIGWDTPTSERPTYGSVSLKNPIIRALAKLFGGNTGKQFANVANPMSRSLDIYGDTSLIGKRSIGKRSNIFGNDILKSYAQNTPHWYWRQQQGMGLPPMYGGNDFGVASGNLKATLGRKFGSHGRGPSINGTPSQWSNPGIPYIETYTKGGFDLKEISKIVTKNPEAIPLIRAALKAQGIKIPVRGERTGLLGKIFGFENGVVSVPGPKGAGDVVPAMLSPGESVIPAKMTSKYAPLINSMISDKIPGFVKGKGKKGGGFNFGATATNPWDAPETLSPKPPTSGILAAPVAPVISEDPRKFKILGTATGEAIAKSKKFVTGVSSGIGQVANKAAKAVAASAQTAVLKRIGAEANAFTPLAGGAVFDNVTKKKYASKAAFDAAQQEIRNARTPGTSYTTPTGKVYNIGDNGKSKYVGKKVQGVATPINGSKLVGGAGAVGGIATMAGMGMMMSGDQSGMGNNLMMGGMALSMLPMLKNPYVAALAAIAGVGFAFYAMNENLKKVREEASKTSVALSSGAAAMKKLGEFAGTVTPTEVMDKMRQERNLPYEIKTGKNTFGGSYIASEAGQELVKQAEGQKLEFGGEDAAKRIGIQLSQAIAGNIITKDQAFSIANNLGEAMKDYEFAVDVNATMVSLLGPGGEDLTKDPLKVQAEIIAARQETVSGAGQAKSLISDDTKGMFGNGRQNFTEVAAAEIEYSQMYKDIVDMGKQNLDQLELEHVKKLEILKAAGDLKGIEKENAKYATDKTSVLETNRKALEAENKYIAGLETSSSWPLQKSAEQIVDNLENSLEKQFENADQKTKDMARLTIENISDNKDLSYATKATLVATMTVENMDLFKQVQSVFPVEGNEQLWEKIAKVTVEMGPGAEEQILSVLPGFSKTDLGKTKATSFVTYVVDLQTKGQTAEAQAALDTMTALQKVRDSKGNPISLDQFIDAKGNVTDKFNELTGDLQEIDALLSKKKGKKLVYAIDFKNDTTGFNLSKEQQAYFDSLSPDQQKVYTTAYLTVTESIDASTPEGKARIEAWRQKERAKGRSAAIVADRLSPAQVVQRIGEEGGYARTGPSISDGEGDGNGDGTGDTGGTKKKDPINDILNRLKMVRDAAINAAGGIKELRRVVGKAGGKDIATFTGIEQNLIKSGVSQDFMDFYDSLDEKAKSTYVSISGSGSKAVAKLKADAMAVQAALREQTIGDYQTSLVRQAQDAKNSAKAFEMLKNAGMSAADALELSKDAKLADAIAAQKNTKDVLGLVDATNKLADAQSSATKFQKTFDEARDAWDAKKNKLDIDFRISTKTFQKAVTDAENEIAEKVNKAGGLDDLQAGLTQIGWAEDEINKKYDLRVEALDKIASVNEKIAAAQRGQLNIADALSRGDISAAAAAVQDERSRAAQDAIATQRELLDDARKAELDGVSVDVNGKKLTRKDIEAQILVIEKDILKIEEDRLEPARESIRLEEVKRLAALASLEEQELEWQKLENDIALAATAAWDYVAALKEAQALAADAAKKVGTNGITGPENTWREAGIDVAKAQKDYVNSQKAFTSSGLSVSAYMRAMDSGKDFGFRSAFSSGGMVKYFADGGTPLGTDIVPAMLTPGEFVMSKYSVDSFGVDKLKAINNGTYSGESVYNYELNVNVKSDANADDIARTVMTQIKQIDSQRLRGNRL